MLIEITISNFRSIKDRQTFSMMPSERVKAENRRNPLFSINEYKDLNLLTLAAIYGKNGAGKSNLIKAFKALEWLVLTSHRFTLGDQLLANEIFAFDIQNKNLPTTFEIDFLGKDRKRYLYFLEFNKEEILREELHYFVISVTGKTTKRKLFIRQNNQSFSFGEDFKGLRKPIEERTRPNVLFLSKSINENNAFLEPVFDFFKTGFRISDFSEGYNEIQIRYFAKMAIQTDNLDMEILNHALRNIDTGIISLTSSKAENLPKKFKIEDLTDSDISEEQLNRRNDLVDTLKTEIKSVHKLFNGEKEIGLENLILSDESEGTQKFIAVFSALIQMIKEGSLMVVDEFDKSFHPILTQTLISFLSNPNINKNGAQLIFTTHDSNLLDSLDYDQINLVEKDFKGATEIYSASDIRGLRGDISIMKRYLRGELEGIPNIDNSAIHKSLESYYASSY